MALDFDGTNDLVSFGDIAALDGAADLTAMAWIWVDNTAVDDGFLGKGQGGTEWHFGTFNSDASIVVFRHDTNFSGRTAASALTSGSWIHWALAYDGGGAGDADKIKIYKNGANQSLTFDASPPATLPDTGTDTFRVMTSEQSASFVDGKMALLKMWTATLTAAEIFQEMNSYRPQRTANLLRWVPFDDGTTAADYSGVGSAGTVTQATQIAGPPVSYGG